MRRRSSPPHPTRWSGVSRVQGGAPAENNFGAFKASHHMLLVTLFEVYVRDVY